MRSKSSLQKTSGFSLLELLLAASLVPLISFVIFSNISSGLRLWRALNESVLEEDPVLFRQKVGADFDRAFFFSPIPFSGETERVAFASTVDSPPELGGELGIGQVSIFFDASKKVLVKQEANWSDLYKEAPGRTRILLQGVHSFHIQYFSFDALEDAYLWMDEWDPTKKHLPLAARFICEMENGASPLIFTFPVQAGG